MTTPTLSEFDRDRVALALRRVGQVAQDLRREYPEAFETEAGGRESSAAAVVRPTGAIARTV